MAELTKHGGGHGCIGVGVLLTVERVQMVCSHLCMIVAC